MQVGQSQLLAYFSEIFCTNGTTLTITIGAGGAGLTSGNGSGADGTASTITGIAGNGASTSISSGAAKGGAVGSVYNPGNLSPQVGFKTLTGGYGGGANYQGKQQSQGFGIGMVSFHSGTTSSQSTGNQSLFGGTGNQIKQAGTQTVVFNTGGTGGPIPLLGSLLHASVGTSGTAGTLAGGSSTANTYFAGTGGGGNYIYVGSAGQGGGGGGGGGSNNSAIPGGNGGNGSANSGGGGGGSGLCNPLRANSGTGGNGGSGLIVIGYWG